jgi:hypothetical protein
MRKDALALLRDHLHQQLVDRLQHVEHQHTWQV